MIGLEECTICVTGAAPLSAETAYFLSSIGLNLVEGYGMSETCAASAMTVENYFKWGSNKLTRPNLLSMRFVSSGTKCARGRSTCVQF